ncbi:MAG: hypothetical protein E6K12_02625 [Methanobacteriota archaeon]|nr:MAG: hypothetical protein E6K12_02625 [Euryarchaeota archaeon]
MRTDGAVVAALLCIALAARLVPLTFSPLPFSIDGFALARISTDMAAHGVWRIDPADVNSYNQKLPGFSLLWAAAAQVGGISPLLHVQLLLPMITCFTVLPAYLLGARATGRRLGGFAAGLFVALFGSFLLLTSAAAKESIGLLVFPVAVLLFHERKDTRKRALAVLLLLFLPFLHSLTTFLTLGMVAALVVLTQRRALMRGRFSWRAFALDVVTGPALALGAWAYYVSVDLPFLSDILAPEALVLFLAVVVLLTALMAPMVRPVPRRMGRRLVSPATKVILPPVVGFVLLAGNAATNLFVGAGRTESAFFLVVPSIVLFAAFAVGGFQLVRRTVNRTSDLIVAMFVAPVALILFGFFRGLDPGGLLLVYRAFDFLDYALAVLIAVAFVGAWRAVGPSRPARAALVTGFLVALLASTPMAWNTPAVFGVQNVTTSEEFHALAVLGSLGARNVTTDQRLADVGRMWFGYSANADLPRKLRDNESLVGADYAVVLERWSTVGAQVHPAPNIVLPQGIVAAFLTSNRVVWTAGPVGDRIFIVQILP